MVPCMFLMLPCMAFCGAAWRGWQLQWFCVHHSRWNVKLRWDFFFGVLWMCWLLIPRTCCDSKRRLTARPAKACTDVWESSVACHPRMKTAKISQYQRWLTVQKPIQPIHLLHIRRHLVRHLLSTSFKSRWPRFLKNLRIKKILFDIIMGSACLRHCYGPRLFFLEGAHDWANVFVLCISHCLVLKQVLKEKMRETIGTYDIFYTKTYSKLHSISELVIPRTVGKSTVYTDNPSFDLEHRVTRLHMTKIPKESADLKDIVWYSHGSCMPKTLLWCKAILFGGSTWLSKCVRALHFPLLGFETCQCLRCILQIELSTRFSSSSFAKGAAVCQKLLKVRDNRRFTSQLEWWNSGGSPMVQGWMGLTWSFNIVNRWDLFFGMLWWQECRP